MTQVGDIRYLVGKAKVEVIEYLGIKKRNGHSNPVWKVRVLDDLSPTYKKGDEIEMIARFLFIGPMPGRRPDC